MESQRQPRTPAELYHLTPVRGLQDVKEATVTIAGNDINVAVIYGTASAGEFIRRLKAGETDKLYHFVEVMSCPGGCISGGGQPSAFGNKADVLREARIASLYKRDEEMDCRTSDENEEIKALYRDFYGEPLSELAEELLHTSYTDRRSDLGEKKMSYRCKVCGYIYEGDELPADYICPLCHKGVEVFEKIEEKSAATGEKTLAGTKTEKNLQAAFAGESQARNKYTYFAEVAKREGYEHWGWDLSLSMCSRSRWAFIPSLL